MEKKLTPEQVEVLRPIAEAYAFGLCEQIVEPFEDGDAKAEALVDAIMKGEFDHRWQDGREAPVA